jgi:hypothetical protein
MKLNLTKAEEIQFIFPSEPDWDLVEDSVLVELVENYFYEQSCATSALTELSHRKSPIVRKLCAFLIYEQNADKWLKRHAFDILLSKHFLEGVNLAENIVKECNAEMLSVLVAALNYELQGDFREFVLSHNVTKHVQARLLDFQSGTIEFSEDFFRNLEKV